MRSDRPNHVFNRTVEHVLNLHEQRIPILHIYSINKHIHSCACVGHLFIYLQLTVCVFRHIPRSSHRNILLTKRIRADVTEIYDRRYVYRIIGSKQYHNE